MTNLISRREVKVSGLSLGTFHFDKQPLTPLYKQNARERTYDTPVAME